MTHFVDLRKKVQPQVKVIREIIVQKQPWYMELAKIVAVIAIVSTVVWGISKADENVSGVATNTPDLSGIYGTVGSINGNFISLVDCAGADFTGHTTFNVDISNLQAVQTADYSPLTLADIQVGDPVTAYGIVNYTAATVIAQNIYSFSDRAPVVVDVTNATTATTTIDVATSTTTSDVVATTTDDISTTTSDVTTATTTLDSTDSFDDTTSTTTVMDNVPFESSDVSTATTTE